jgi:hypothetical protein
MFSQTRFSPAKNVQTPAGRQCSTGKKRLSARVSPAIAAQIVAAYDQMREEQKASLRSPEIIRQIEVSCEVQKDRESLSLAGVLDTGSEVNLIDIAMAQRLNLTEVPTVNIGLSSFTSVMQDQYQYGAFNVPITITDSWGRTRTTIRLFYGVEREKMAPLLMGLPFLSDEGIVVDIRRRRWRYEHAGEKYELLRPKNFFKKARAHGVVYAMFSTGESN